VFRLKSSIFERSHNNLKIDIGKEIKNEDYIGGCYGDAAVWPCGAGDRKNLSNKKAAPWGSLSFE
jgi:hypothetical protein